MKIAVHLYALAIILLAFHTSSFAQCTEPTGITSNVSGTNKTTFSWSPVTDAIGYEYVLNNDSMPGSVGSSTLSTTVLMQGLKPDTKYCLHVRTVCSSGVSTWTTYCFILPCTGITVSSLAVDKITDVTARISWEPFAQANGYEYAITNSPVPPTAMANVTNNNMIMAQGFTPNTFYCAHVRARCSVSSTFTDWVTQCFTTLAEPSGISNTPGNNTVSIYPNPVNRLLNINIPGITGKHRLYITDIVGKIVHQSGIEQETTSVDISSLSPGLYFVNISGNNYTAVHRIVKE